jgi:hypothetical protein
MVFFKLYIVNTNFDSLLFCINISQALLNFILFLEVLMFVLSFLGNFYGDNVVRCELRQFYLFISKV